MEGGPNSIMANLTRLDPLGEMVSLRHAMDRLFEDSFVSPLGWRTISGGDSITPALDVHETDDHLVVTAALPGVKPDDVEITNADAAVCDFEADDVTLRIPKAEEVKPRQIRISAGSGQTSTDETSANGSQAS